MSIASFRERFTDFRSSAKTLLLQNPFGLMVNVWWMRYNAKYPVGKPICLLQKEGYEEFSPRPVKMPMIRITGD